jgi:glutamate/tyrosine decarboxylase-like PLP-dependent enzyme
MEALRTRDVRWRDGRAFSLAYSAGPEALALAEEAYRRFSGENALNVGAFPSLKSMQQDVVDVVAGWCSAPPSAAGFMTSGGTESLVLVVRAALVRARREGRKLAHPNMVLPASAHAALDKGGDYFGVEVRRAPVCDDWTADVDAMAGLADSDTILVVGSAPQYPQGVVDPIPAIARLAESLGANCHVDACMGGVTLPSLERLGHPVAPWDFRVEGVTSISVDLHKYGYTSKGAGVLIHRDRERRQDQTFFTDNWLGGAYGSSGILGTKSGGPIASAWAVMHYLGHDGYDQLTLSARRAAQQISAYVKAHSALTLRAEPDTTLLSFGVSDPIRHDVFAIADALGRRDWYVDRQGPPPSIHLSVNAVHASLVDEFLADLDAAIVEAEGSSGGTGAYAVTE